MRIITNNDGFTLFVVDKIMKDTEDIASDDNNNTELL